MTSEKNINGMVYPDEPSTSGMLTSPDDNANLKSETTKSNNSNVNKGAIPKIKSKTKSKCSKKSAKINNNIDDEYKNDLTKLNGMTNGASFIVVDQKFADYEIPLPNNSTFHDDRGDKDVIQNGGDDLIRSIKSVCVLNEPLDFRDDTQISANSSDDDDLFSLSDDGCIYTYKGDQVADLPSSFFNLNNLVPLQVEQPKENNVERNSSPEMDFLEMDFDPGPSESSEINVEAAMENVDNQDRKKTLSDAHSNATLSSNAWNILIKPISGNHVNYTTKSPARDCDNIKKCNKDVNLVLPISKVTPTGSDGNASHNLYPWLCSISERTTSSKQHAREQRCHYTRGEFISPSEWGTLPKSNRTIVTNGCAEEAMIWTEVEAYVMQVNQIGPSACGATAVLNVLNALRFPIPSLDELNESIRTKLRANAGPLKEYLLSRSVAGTDHNDIIDGLHRLSKNQVYARFFHFYPERVVNLQKWLTFWIRNGCVPIATLNLQKCVGTVPDAWHHQMIYGVGPKGIFLTNPYECVEPDELWPQLCSESILLIRREDVMKRWDIKTDLKQLMGIQDEKWRRLNVVGQVANMVHESERELKKGFINTSHIRIPAAYSSGITLAIRADSPYCKLLKQCPELPVFHEDMPEPDFW